ncbi:SEFIR domain-containing protein [Amycolatopsis sp. cmx-8-4]|uniref:SEFIR domain-containing protein n=1 Tax=Amycolatopsis sp. cmx-8-4 TaxID=2790947 RepID=UPI00397D131D
MVSPEQYDRHEPGDHPKVFVSYTHDSERHREDVLQFAAFLVTQGVDVVLDRWASGQRQDWQVWATKNITESDYVLIVASEGYRRMGDGYGPNDSNLGGQAEAALLRDLLQGDRTRWTTKLLPVLLPGHDKREIPNFLQPNAADWYEIPSNTPEGAEGLLRVITRQPRDVRPPLGPRPLLPPLAGFPAAKQGQVTLLEELPVTWRAEILPRHYQAQSPLVEVHLVPAASPARHGVLELERICDELAALGRSERLFSQEQAISVGSSADAAWAFSADWRAGECGLTVLRGGQRTCWFPLPKVGVSRVLDREHLAPQVTDRLNTLLAIDLPIPDSLAPAIGLDPISATTRLGKISDASANTATFSMNSPGRVRIGTEEAFPTEDLRTTSKEIAEELVARLAAPLSR